MNVQPNSSKESWLKLFSSCICDWSYKAAYGSWYKASVATTRICVTVQVSAKHLVQQGSLNTNQDLWFCPYVECIDLVHPLETVPQYMKDFKDSHLDS